MKKKLLITFLSVLCVACLLGTASCAGDVIRQQKAEGYTVVVNFDTNGGTLAGNEKVSLIDMYRPADYQADENGNVHIRIVDPVDPSRPNVGYNELTNPYPLTKFGYTLVGWFRTRAESTDGEGNVVYTYSDQWDFGTDAIECKADDEETVELTLYAVWTEYFKFEYYTEENGEWTKYAETEFGVIPSEVADTDKSEVSLYLPYWKDGKMTYTSGSYTFPQVEGKTFEAAYADEEKADRIDLAEGEAYVHRGSVDEHGVALDRVVKIYVEFLDGQFYRIETASQLVSNASPTGNYEIGADLDFTGLRWPAAFVNGTFKGNIYGKDDRSFTFSNITATFSSSSATRGGLFGTIASGASIRNISFENVTVDFASCGARKTDVSFGLFAGYIEEGATLTGVSVTAAQMRIGALQEFNGDYSFHLLANGNTAGIAADVSSFGLTVYGEKIEYFDYITYKVNPEATSVDAEGNITVTFNKTLEEEQRFDQLEYVIQERR